MTMRLRQCFFEVYLPSRPQTLQPATLTGYAESLGHWERLTDDPPLERITDRAISAWSHALVDDPDWQTNPGGQLRLNFDRPVLQQTLFGAARGAPRKKRRGSTTADKHLRWLRAVLRAAQAAGLIASVPKIPFARTGRPNPRPIPPEDLDRIYAACEVATLPQIGGVFPGHWWRAALCVAISCGCRRTALQQLRWENIDLSGRLLWEGSDADKRKQERCKALPAVAVAHLMRVRNTLPGPFWWTGYREGFDRQWHAIQSAAGIPRGRHYKWHATKHTCGTEWARQGAEAHALQSQLGHSQLATGEYYVRVAGQMKAAERFELPPCFSADLPAMTQRQG